MLEDLINRSKYDFLFTALFFRPLWLIIYFGIVEKPQPREILQWNFFWKKNIDNYLAKLNMIDFQNYGVTHHNDYNTFFS